ncbi:MAG: extracellular solute-binding protein [Pseudomonadota bacterium]
MAQRDLAWKIHRAWKIGSAGAINKASAINDAAAICTDRQGVALAAAAPKRAPRLRAAVMSAGLALLPLGPLAHAGDTVTVPSPSTAAIAVAQAPAIQTASAGLTSSSTAAAATATAGTETETWHHALSLVGTPKYGPDFKHFNAVNPAAPKGGTLRLRAIGTFDTLNPFPDKGAAVAGGTLIYDTLMTASLETGSTEYGLVAEAVKYPSDYSSATFRLREGAKFHDGEPIKPEDVIFSFEKLKEVSAQFAFYYKNVVKAEQTGPREVTFSFDVKNNRELPQIVGQLVYVLPKHYWTGTDADGKPRDLGSATLETPIGSGPYRFGKVVPGRSVALERVEDYWAKDLPVRLGQYNFDIVQYEYFRDPTVAFEAFKAGQYDYVQVNSSQQWATGFDFPAISNGEILKEELALERLTPMQGFAFNLRKEKFKDVRVREAFNLAFDFEWTKENLFFGLYDRVSSYFGNSELEATGLPEGQELAILETVRDQVPPEVFTTPFANPVSGDDRKVRTNLRRAFKLLQEAGWRRGSGQTVLRNAAGETFDVEFLIVSPTFERVILPYVQRLKQIGINGTVRLVDTSQYQRRVREFDFDIITDVVSQSNSPGNEQREFWGSDAADRRGSRNRAGIKNPGIDALIDKVIFAKDRPELVAATRALDRVLLWNRYHVLQWTNPRAWVARQAWLQYPKTRGKRGVTVIQTWWDGRLDGGAQ